MDTLHSSRFLVIIGHVSDIVFTIAQVIYFLWPVTLLIVLVYSLQGRFTWKAIQQRVRRNLLLAWLALTFVWLATLFASTPNPSLVPEPWNSLVFFGGLALLLVGEISRVRGFKRRVSARMNLHHGPALRELMAMDPYDFEDLVAEVYRAYGHHAEQVGQSGDHGIDVQVRTRDGKRWVVQCKRYRDSVGERYVRELYGTLMAEKADQGVLVTTADITPPAEAWARGKPIELVDGPALLKLIDGAQRRMQGTFFDRLTWWLESLFPPRPPLPAGLRHSLEHTQPVEVNASHPGPNGRVKYQNGVPVCPRCGLLMVPRRPRPGDRPGRVLYRCKNYPTCRVVLERKTENVI